MSHCRGTEPRHRAAWAICGTCVEGRRPGGNRPCHRRRAPPSLNDGVIEVVSTGERYGFIANSPKRLQSPYRRRRAASVNKKPEEEESEKAKVKEGGETLQVLSFLREEDCSRQESTERSSVEQRNGLETNLDMDDVEKSLKMEHLVQMERTLKEKEKECEELHLKIRKLERDREDLKSALIDLKEQGVSPSFSNFSFSSFLF